MDKQKKKNDKPKYGNCPGIDEIDFIGVYGSSNTYTANIPEDLRYKYTRPDSARRVAHVNPNRFIV